MSRLESFQHPNDFTIVTRSPRNIILICIAATALIVACLDAATKLLAVAEQFEPTELFAGLSLEVSKNPGVAFGFLGDLPGCVVTGFVGAVMCVLMLLMWREGEQIGWLAGGLLMGGASANLIDRAADGYVTDFIDPARWPAFNLADIAISCGALLTVWRLASATPTRPKTESSA